MGQLEDWWNEDAERLNRLAEVVQQKGYAVTTGNLVPPKLEGDGSIAEVKTARKHLLELLRKHSKQ